jgi:hypothetical protein
MMIWILALGLLVVLGLALAIASFVPMARRQQGPVVVPDGQPLFFQRHMPPERPPIALPLRRPADGRPAPLAKID